MTISELRILPPLAIGRLGASEHPLENYDLKVSPEDPIGFREIRGAETLEVDNASGEIRRSYKPDRVRFRDGPKIRPVAPFLEVFARTAKDVLEPLTVGLLDRHGLKPGDVKWRVHVGNHKVFRRTGKPGDRIDAEAAFCDHQRYRLDGCCPHFHNGKTLSLGFVQYIMPNSAFPEIRLRFTPAGGWVYGASRRRKEPDEFGSIHEVDDPILTREDQIVYDPDKGCWRGFTDGTTPLPLQTNPGAIYAGYSDPKTGNQISWGYLDDECDGIVTVELAVGGKTLSAFARIGAGPPTFAPDSIPIRTIADELDQAANGPAADDAVSLEEAEEIVRRAIESVRLMNTAVLNANRVQGRVNAQSTMPRQDTNDFGRYYDPVMAPTLVDSHAVLALHQSILAALRSGTGAWFAQVLRRPEEIGDLGDLGRRKMPAMMRGADGRYLTLTRRQIDTIVKAAVGSLFEAAQRGDGR